MSVTYEDNWPFFEKVLGWMRYQKIRKYIFAFRHPVCVDIGCGFNGRFLRSIAKHIGGGMGLISVQMRQSTAGCGLSITAGMAGSFRSRAGKQTVYGCLLY